VITKKRVILASLILIAVLMSGCIKLTINQVINADGSSEVQVIYDMSALSAMAQAFANESADGEDASDSKSEMEESCAGFYNSTSLQNPRCSVTDDLKVVMSGETSLDGNPAFKVSRSIPYVTYTFDAKAVNSILSDVGDAQGQSFDTDQLKQAKAAAGAMGMSFTYVVQMPGTIYEADAGTIEEDKITIDIFDMLDSENVYIKSRELNLLWDIGLIVIVVITVFLVILFLGKRGNKIQSNAQEQYQQAAYQSDPYRQDQAGQQQYQQQYPAGQQQYPQQYPPQGQQAQNQQQYGRYPPR